MKSAISVYILLIEIGLGTQGFLVSPNSTQATESCKDLDTHGCSVNPSICQDPVLSVVTCPRTCKHCVDGAWSGWQNWGTCDVTCGSGMKSRTRLCDNPTPANGGDMCIGDSSETTQCDLSSCPVNGGWSVWGDWGTCTSSCGMGLQHRGRTCNNPKPLFGGEFCLGDNSEYRICIDMQCTGAIGWTSWAGWSTCSLTCGSGTQSRTRACQNPAASHLNNSCQGDSSETRACTDISCTIGWTSWTGWSTCSSTCGTGSQSRTRNCQNPAASALNSSCPGDSTDYRTCTDSSCTSLFTATGRVTIPGTNNIRFRNVEVNEGGDYNSSTGVFTCRIPGQYWIAATITKVAGDNVDFVSCHVMINGIGKLIMYTDPATDETAVYSMSASAGFRLRLGDRVQVGRCGNPDHIYSTVATFFSGILIKPDV